jgi:hypothetical protein
MASLLLGLAGSAAGADYYLSSSGGSDAAVGTSPAAAWRSLERAGKAAFAPGDRLLLKAGDRFAGSLVLGSPDRVLEGLSISAHGEGTRPVIDGMGAEAALALANPSKVSIAGLELTNPSGRFGLRLTARDAGALGPVTVEGLEIHHVNDAAWSQPVDPGHGRDKYFGGINIEVLRGEKPSWWEGLVIRDCEVHDLGPCGISIGSAYPLHEQMRSRRGRDPFPILGVLIERNVIRDITRDGAIIRQCQGAVMQHNEVARTGQRSLSNGIWFWDCEGSTIRYNIGTGCGVQGMVDGGPFSIDYYCKDCVIEFNYSHDNEGPGFMAFGNRRTGTGTVVRGNVSYHDATAELKPGFAAASMISTLSKTLVEDNVVIAGPETRALLGHHDWEGMPTDVTYRDNLIVGNGKAKVEPSVLTGGTFEGNRFAGVPDLPAGVGSPEPDTAPATAEAMNRREELMAKAGRQGAGETGAERGVRNAE